MRLKSAAISGCLGKLGGGSSIQGHCLSWSSSATQMRKTVATAAHVLIAVASQSPWAPEMPLHSHLSECHRVPLVLPQCSRPPKCPHEKAEREQG